MLQLMMRCTALSSTSEGQRYWEREQVLINDLKLGQDATSPMYDLSSR